MRHITFLFTIVAVCSSVAAVAQTAPPADWKTWVIPSGQQHGVPPPPDAASTRQELEWLRAAATEQDPRIVAQIRYWDAGPPSLRWMHILNQRFLNGQAAGSQFRAYMYLPMAMYDATIAVENAKRAYKRARPTGESIVPRVAVPPSSSYPSDYAATAAAAATILAYLVPAEATYFQQLAEEAGKSRLYAGVEYPSDYLAGMELGRRVAEQVIQKAQADGSNAVFSGSIPTGPCKWVGTNPGNAAGPQWKPMVLVSASELRPPPPPACDSVDVQSQLAEVRNYPRALTTANIFTNARALYWQTPEGLFPWAVMRAAQWMLEDKWDHQPARAARAFTLMGVAGYDAFIASQDGKFAYWYARPAMLDPSLVPLFPAPNFPSYPSNHSTFSAARAEVAAYLFPLHAEEVRALGKEAGDSRIWAGIHFQMDNVEGVRLGQGVARKVIAWAENDGSK